MKMKTINRIRIHTGQIYYVHKAAVHNLCLALTIWSFINKRQALLLKADTCGKDDWGKEDQQMGEAGFCNNNQ